MNDSGKNIKVVAVLLGLSLLGAIFVGVTTSPRGVTMTPDTASYYQAATSFSTGDGFLVYDKKGVLAPMTHYPPVYPMALSLGRFFGMEVAEGSRYLAIFLVGLNILLVAWFAFYVSGTLLAATATAVILLTSVHFIQAHAAAWSEPMFFPFMFGALIFLVRYVEKNTWRSLGLAALCAGLCYMTRYAGLAVIIAGAVVAGVATQARGGKKALAVLGFLAPALLLPAVWTVRNLSVTGQPIGFMPGFSFEEFRGVWTGLDSVSQYFFPASVPVAARMALAAGVLGGVWVVMTRFWRQRAASVEDVRYGHAARVAGIFCVTYAVASVAWLALSRGDMTIETRILLPLLVVAAPFFGVVLARNFSAGLRSPGMILVVILMLVMLGRTAQFAGRVYHNGDGYNARAWADTALVKTVKTLSDRVAVYTNDPKAFYFYTGRGAALIPRFGQNAAAFFSLEDVQARFLHEGAVAVIFNEKAFEPADVWWKLVRRVPLAVSFRDGWGSIYGLRRAAGEAR
jgi:4-amino-4-deoxy-L-arabinose transferase-like glycosyltransferase